MALEDVKGYHEKRSEHRPVNVECQECCNGDICNAGGCGEPGKFRITFNLIHEPKWPNFGDLYILCKKVTHNFD